MTSLSRQRYREFPFRKFDQVSVYKWSIVQPKCFSWLVKLPYFPLQFPHDSTHCRTRFWIWSIDPHAPNLSTASYYCLYVFICTYQNNTFKGKKKRHDGYDYRNWEVNGWEFLPGMDSKYSNSSGPIRLDGHFIDIWL
jgi:hypothetical protein